MPNRDGDRRSPSDAERARVAIILCENAEFGALRDSVTWLPCTIAPCWTDAAVSCNAPSVAYCELDWNDPCERVSEGDDISFFTQHKTSSLPLQSASKMAWPVLDPQQRSVGSSRSSPGQLSCALVFTIPRLYHSQNCLRLSSKLSSASYAWNPAILGSLLQPPTICSSVTLFVLSFVYSSIFTCVLLYSSAQLVSRACSTSVWLQNHLWGLSRDILCNPNCGCHVWVTRSFCWVNTELNTTLAAALTTVPTRITRGDDETERCTPECSSELRTQTLRWKVLQQDRRARIQSTPQTDVARPFQTHPVRRSQ